MALLIAGLGLGQGTIFIVQTVLVAAGEYGLLATFGTHYSFAILGIILVDAGASTILAREVARSSAEPMSRDDVWQIFWETSAIRLLVALLVGAVAAVYAFGFASDGFSRWYVALALPGLLCWAVNGVGLLDGLRLSGVSGITGSAAYVFTAIGLALAAHKPAETAGAILGGAFSLGYLVTLGAQWTALGRKGWIPRFRRPTRAGLARSLKDGSALLFQFVPGQINMRVQLVLSSVYLDAEMTALFIYAKQIVTAAMQIIGFVLRVEFPGLVEKLAESGKHSFASILGAQKMALYCAVLFAVAHHRLVRHRGGRAGFPPASRRGHRCLIRADDPDAVAFADDDTGPGRAGRLRRHRQNACHKLGGRYVGRLHAGSDDWRICVRGREK